MKKVKKPVSSKQKNSVVASSKKRALSTRTKVSLSVLGTLLIAAVGYATYSYSVNGTLSLADAAGAGTCGKGYKFEKNWPVIDDNGNNGPVVLKQYYKGAAHRNHCFLLIATGKASGVAKFMRVNTKTDRDQGQYKQYAGPVYGNCKPEVFAQMNWNGKSYVGPIGRWNIHANGCY